MPILPNPLERLLFVNLSIGPAPMLDIFGAVAFRVVWAAHRLGVFDALSDGPLAPSEVARKVNADEHGITALLEAVEALGYVRARDGRFANTPMATKWMTRNSPAELPARFGTLLP